jgi:23S rRNA pseudouridine2605 synthase
MEEKKRRPRLKADTDSPLEERTESKNSTESSENQSSPFERKPLENRSESGEERKPWQDRSQSGGGERKPWEDRSGGGERKPWQDRSQSGGGERKPWEDRSGGGERKPWQDRSQSGGGERKPWEDRSGGGERKPWQDRNQAGGGERKPWEDRSGGGERKPWVDRNQSGGGERKPWEDRSGGGERKPWVDRNQSGGGERKPWEDRSGGGERKPWVDRNQTGGGERKPWEDRSGGGERKPWVDRNQSGGGERKPWEDRSGGGERKPWQDRNQAGGGERKPWQDRSQSGGGERKPWQKPSFGNKPFGKKPFHKKDDFFVERKPKPGLPSGEGMPLNKYLAHCGIASRRKSVDFINDGKVLVNGEVKTEPFYRIMPTDVVICDGKTVSIQERQVYVLLNKPKNVITSTEDEHGRATVLDIVDPSFPERLFPVGRLDRDTTGLILLTNDGDLAQKLTHPSYAVHKQYRVGLRSSLTQGDLEQIERGVELEDGLMEINWIRFSEDHPNRDIVELEITSGRNRIVRRLFEHLGYEVFKLDRFYFAGLTKKDLPRGSFRELTQREVIMLKHFTGHPSTGKKRKREDGEEGEDMPQDELEQGMVQDTQPEIDEDTTEQETAEV